jgi:flagellar protein FlaG
MNIQAIAATRNEERSAIVEAPGTASTAVAKANAVPATTATGKAQDGNGVEPTRKELEAAVDKLNQSMTASSQDLQFSVDEDSKKTVVKLIDRTTHEVLRQMPTKEALEIAKSLDKAMGKLIDQSA